MRWPANTYRRKEQNQIKRSIGFNWGPAAMATTVWTGVPLRHVLAAAGVTKPEQGRRFVCFAGPKVRLSARHSRPPVRGRCERADQA